MVSKTGKHSVNIREGNEQATIYVGRPLVLHIFCFMLTDCATVTVTITITVTVTVTIMIMIMITIMTMIMIMITIMITITITISNSNWTEWSTIQGVIERVISKWEEREARGRFEITSTIIPWIVRHEVQLLIYRIYNKFREKMSSESFFWAKTSVALFLSVENCRKHCKGSLWGARNWHENHVGIQLQVCDYKKFKSDSCNWTPTWSRADYVANRRAENQSRSRILL